MNNPHIINTVTDGVTRCHCLSRPTQMTCMATLHISKQCQLRHHSFLMGRGGFRVVSFANCTPPLSLPVSVTVSDDHPLQNMLRLSSHFSTFFLRCPLFALNFLQQPPSKAIFWCPPPIPPVPPIP